MRVIKSERKIDFTWIHNYENNIKSFTDHIRQLAISERNVSVSQEEEDEKSLSLSANLKVEPFFSGYDFQIADYMSLQKLEFDNIEKYNELSDIKQIAK